MKSQCLQSQVHSQFKSCLGVVLIGTALCLSGFSGENSGPSASSQGINHVQGSLNTEILPTPLSTAEADRFFAIVATTGGKYYAAGFTTVNNDSQMVVARVTENGVLDPTFGSNGIATVNVAVGAGKKAELARSVIVQSDGKVVIAGPIEHDTTVTGDAARDTDIAVVRLDMTGQLDQTFGLEHTGIVRLNLSTGAVDGTAFRGDTAWGLTRLPGDHLLVVGGKRADGIDRTDIDYAVVKLTPNGLVDTTFGTHGLVTLDVEQGADSPRTAIVQPDGKIVVCGHTEIAEDTPNEVTTTVLFRLTSDGQFDPTFGKNGVVSNALDLRVAEAYDVALQGSRLIIVGYGRSANATTVDVISARFFADGTWDKSYGKGGVAIIDVAGEDDRSRALKVLPDQRVLIVGQGKPTATAQDGAVVLLTDNGHHEKRHHSTGVTLLDFGGSTDALFGLALSPDHTQAVAVGWKGVNPTDASATNNDDARIVRLALPTQ